MNKLKAFLIAVLSALLLDQLIVIPVFLSTGMFRDAGGNFTLTNYLRWTVFFFATFFLLATVTASHKFAGGRLREILFVVCSILLFSELICYLLFTLIECGFDFTVVDWFGSLDKMMTSAKYYLLLFVAFAGLFFGYCFVINRNFIAVFGKSGITGRGKLKQVYDTNLENSRWMTDQEMRDLFKVYPYSKLGEVKKDGIPVSARMDGRGRELEVAFQSPCHAIVIGSTGSGKTTTFVSPMIQLLAATKAGSSMVITDPKGELFNLHSKYLADRGYDVKVVDLRDTYSSSRWNPLDGIWDAYQDYREAHRKAAKRSDDVTASGLELTAPEAAFAAASEWYEFDGKAYLDYQRLLDAVKTYRKKIYDEVYEDLNDLVSVLIPVENEKDPLWEKGARSITLATLLAMLEDSDDEKNGMTKEKFNFFNMAKILQNSNQDYEELRAYFSGRSPLSKAASLSKQVCDAAPTTRASYMSIVYDKLMLFNDAGICALTSCSDFSATSLSDHPTALFFKIPDEKDTRHKLAAVFILNIYKTLIKVASAQPSLSLPRNVYFIMDEFGNMPRIEKFDKFITVGRSRKIWFVMIVQSYAQLNNVYGETVADIVKGNCGIKMFIGSNDMGTCKEYSELCGNITVASASTSGSANSETNFSTSLQVRPLIYPSELQRLNKPGDIGLSIIVTFGNYPLKTYFTPSFKVPLYRFGKIELTGLDERYFNENEVFYDVRVRNAAAGVSPANNRGGDAKKTAKAKKDPGEPKADEGISTREILAVYRKFKRRDPALTFEVFCRKVAAGEIIVGHTPNRTADGESDPAPDGADGNNEVNNNENQEKNE